MRNVEVELPPEVLEAIDAEAERREKTRSRVASEMLGEWLARNSETGTA
jgi:metal-responsive CopG/Arc/MetJ family transcriptional regulator